MSCIDAWNPISPATHAYAVRCSATCIRSCLASLRRSQVWGSFRGATACQRIRWLLSQAGGRGGCRNRYRHGGIGNRHRDMNWNMYMAGTGTDLCSHSYRSACNYTHRYNHLEIPVCRTLAGTLNAFFFLPQGMSSCNANPCVPHCPARLLQIGTTTHLDPGNAILPKMEEAYAKYAQDQERNHNRRDHTLHLDSPVEIGFRSRKLAEVRRAR